MDFIDLRLIVLKIIVIENLYIMGKCYVLNKYHWLIIITNVIK